MIPPQFDYHAPGSLDEALGLLGSLDDPKVMSGGQSLLPMLKLRLASPANIVDIGRIPGLDTLAEEDGFLRIGAWSPRRNWNSRRWWRRPIPSCSTPRR